MNRVRRLKQDGGRLVFASCNFDKWQVRCQKCCELFVCSSAPIASIKRIADPSLPETWIADGNPPPPLSLAVAALNILPSAHIRRGEEEGGRRYKARDSSAHIRTHTHAAGEEEEEEAAL